METSTFLGFTTEAWVAIATFALALVTFFLVLETRAARRDATDMANVVARLTTSRGGEVNDALYLDNLGPAIARDVDLTIRYLDAEGAEVKASSLQIPAMAPGDHYPFVPAYILLEPIDTKGLDRADEEAAENGWSLEIKWSWLDNRRRFGRWTGRQRHHEKTVVDLAAYRTAITKGPLFVEPDEYTAIRDLARDAERRDSRDELRRMSRESSGRPEIDVIVDEHRIRYQVALWRARLGLFLRLLLRRHEDDG